MSYFLVCLPDTRQERSFPLQDGSNIIGRSPNNHIAIKHNSLSRRHAEIIVGQKGVVLRDLNSLNGTFVNEQQIHQEQLVQPGDMIVCGMVIFKLIYKGVSPFATNPDPQEQGIDTQGIPIVRQLSPRQTRIEIQDILDSSSPRQTGSALKIREQNEAQRALDKLKILLEVSKELSSPEDPDKLLEKILDLLLKIMNVDRAAILMVNETTRQLEQKAIRSRSGISISYQFYSTQITNYVLKHGDAILTDEARKDQRFEGSDSILIQAIRSSMCAPLQPKEEVLGVLYVDNLSCSKAYTEEDLEFLTALASQAAIAIENARLTNKMQSEAIWRDKLERFFPTAVSRKLREEGHLDIIDTEVTALFADISDFTKMSSTMQPREVIEMLNDYFNVMVEEIVFAYEGTLEKYIGDALLAIWGAPYPQENDAQQAVQAAIDMQWAVRRLNREWKKRNRQPIAIHIGLNTGKVAAGNIGSRKLIQYAAIGDTTNVTSRICNVARAGEILLSQSTMDQLQPGLFALEKLRPVRVKGKTEPLQLYRLDWRQTPVDQTIVHDARFSQ
ncbi:FHA domain-containing protein [Spirulina subsalsa FACHB-351]|uniref:FHA domain-containing protein n=1 Tax=Spirulina subsalsa FACHB-351 TaxID=234711 RepID=A0ABT3L664_9CYAN|nr:adenylate/guanylate cyclase domain-containing protein [Spirulina subsalsa]MCW6036989.1 FHA domain-containing protein [Spirulina subsalsa FACHB-351]